MHGNTFSVICSCGDMISMDAETREEAVAKIQEMMTEETIKVHAAEKHPGQEIPPQERIRKMIEEKTALM